MKTSSVVLLIGAMLAAPAMVSAQNASLEICNNGRFEIDVAVAARVQLFITGYQWKNSGWYQVPARSCAVVYSEEYDAAGPFTPQSGARVAYTLVNSDGVWGAYLSSVKNSGGWMRSGAGEICVKRGAAFSSTRPAGDPAANCDGMTIPVADEFLPDHPGNYTVTMDWTGDEFFMPLAAGQQASVNTPAAQPEDSLGTQFLKALAKAAADENQKEKQAAAERQSQEQAAEAQRQSEAAATAPAAPPSPAAAPSSPLASATDDDPIGGGGFITPPDPRIMLCVQAGLIQLDHDSWNMPVIDGKMIAFQHFIGSYILSVAQPGWLYGITDKAYARFDPAAASDPAGFVSPIPPDRQATPGNCPGGYSTFWLQRKQ